MSIQFKLKAKKKWEVLYKTNMLACQKAHIRNNYPELIKATRCTVSLLTRLERDGHLSSEDVEELSTKTATSLEKSKMMYEILQTRTGSYKALCRALEAECQTLALKILKNQNSHFEPLNLISIDKSQVLGKGRYGTKVFRGKFDGRDVAVKLVQEDIRQAMKEVEILKKLDYHANIIRYYFAEQSDTKVYIALELCYVNLQDQVEIKLLVVDQYNVLKQCIMGVAFLHAKNIIHRDLKPANILLTVDGQIKISDFGFSKHVGVGASSSTASGVYGTPDWMAPEVLEMVYGNKEMEVSKISTMADVFSLGCVFYFVLTNGNHPFGPPGHRTYKILNHNHDVLNSTVEERWKETISAMISEFPKRRPTSDKLLVHWKVNTLKTGTLDSLSLMDNAALQTVNKLPRSSNPSKEQKYQGLDSSMGNFLEELDTKRNFTRPNPEASNIPFQVSEIKHTYPASKYASTGLSATAFSQSGEVPPTKPAQSSSQYGLIKKISKAFEHMINPNLSKSANGLQYPKSESSNASPNLVTKAKLSDKQFRKKLEELNIPSKYIDIAFANINGTDQENYPILHTLILNGADVELFQACVQRGVDVNCKDPNGLSILHTTTITGNFDLLNFLYSNDFTSEKCGTNYDYILFWSLKARSNFVRIVHTFVKNGKNINAVDRYGNSVFSLAVYERKNVDELKELVYFGADPNQKNAIGVSSLHLAAELGNHDVIEYLITLGVDINGRTKFGSSPLHFCAYNKNNFLETVRLLLKHGADIRSVDSDGDSLLSLAALENKTVFEVIKLVKYGANPKQKNSNEETVLHLAAARGNFDVIGYLTRRGLDINGKSKLGVTPLHQSVYNRENFLKTVRCLLNYGADIHDVDNDGDNLFSLAVLEGKSVDELMELVKLGANPVHRNANYQTSMHSAAARCSHAVIGYLISVGLCVNAQTTIGSTPLHFSAYRSKNFLATVCCLLRHGANIEHADHHGDTLFSLAVLERKPVKELEKLVNLGANPHTKNTNDESALHYAAATGNLSVVGYLISLGLNINETWLDYLPEPANQVRRTWAEKT